MRSVRYRRFWNKAGYRMAQKRLGSLFLILIFAVLTFYSLSLYQTVFRPTLRELGTAYAARLGQDIIHSAVTEISRQEPFLSAQMVSIEKSDDGQIAAVVPDTAMMNHLKSELALCIQKKLGDAQNATVAIPLGNLTGVELFSNLGPRIYIHLIPYGKAFVDFESRFSDAGINQTRHQMLANIKADISLLMPDNSQCGTQITACIPMSETVVVGSVPNSYTNLETEPEKVKDDLLNLIE